MIEELVGHIEPYPLRLSAGLLAIVVMMAGFGAACGLAIAACVLVLRVCGIEVVIH